MVPSQPQMSMDTVLGCFSERPVTDCHSLEFQASANNPLQRQSKTSLGPDCKPQSVTLPAESFQPNSLPQQPGFVLGQCQTEHLNTPQSNQTSCVPGSVNLHVNHNLRIQTMRKCVSAVSLPIHHTVAHCYGSSVPQSICTQHPHQQANDNGVKESKAVPHVLSSNCSSDSLPVCEQSASSGSRHSSFEAEKRRQPSESKSFRPGLLNEYNYPASEQSPRPFCQCSAGQAACHCSACDGGDSGRSSIYTWACNKSNKVQDTRISADRLSGSSGVGSDTASGSVYSTSKLYQVTSSSNLSLIESKPVRKSVHSDHIPQVYNASHLKIISESDTTRELTDGFPTQKLEMESNNEITAQDIDSNERQVQLQASTPQFVQLTQWNMQSTPDLLKLLNNLAQSDPCTSLLSIPVALKLFDIINFSSISLIRGQACHTLSKFITDKAVCKAAVSEGVLRVLVSLLRNSSDPSELVAVLLALYKVCLYCPANVIVKENVVKAVVRNCVAPVGNLAPPVDYKRNASDDAKIRAKYLMLEAGLLVLQLLAHNEAHWEQFNRAYCVQYAVQRLQMNAPRTIVYELLSLLVVLQQCETLRVHMMSQEVLRCIIVRHMRSDREVVRVQSLQLLVLLSEQCDLFASMVTLDMYNTLMKYVSKCHSGRIMFIFMHIAAVMIRNPVISEADKISGEVLEILVKLGSMPGLRPQQYRAVSDMASTLLNSGRRVTSRCTNEGAGPVGNFRNYVT